MRKRLRPTDTETFFKLLNVAKGKVKADLYLQGATIINVYTGQLQQANVAVKGKQIAYVGPSDAMVGPETEVVDLQGRFLSPGYIEPHCHPFQVYNPDTLARFVLPHGTTTMVNDNMGLYLLVDDERFLNIVDEMGDWPVKMLWSARLDPQTHSDEFDHFFAAAKIGRLLDHHFVVQSGEITGWPQLLAGDRQMAENILYTLSIGKRVEGHLPGASLETLSMLTAAGITAEHEAMTAEEAVRRLQIGLWTTLRYSSLRPDLPDIVKGLAAYKGDTKRMMMTTDGSTPAFLKNGYTDEMLRVAIEAGMDPITAYQLVTINPATYYGLDGEIGGIAPGRLSDIVVLEALDNPEPLAVLAEGEWAARDGKLLTQWPAIEWEKYGLHKQRAEWRAKESDLGSGADFCTDELPVIRLENPAITRLVESGTVRETVRPMVAALYDREGTTIVKARLTGMAERLDGLASSYTASKGLLAIGQDPAAMTQALNRVLEIGGGIVLVEDGSVVFEMVMPIAGGMSDSPMEQVIARSQEFEDLLKKRGHTHYDPIYTLLFLTSTHLPEVRLTPEGILHVKSGQIIRKPVKLG